MNTI
ncbi:hypothetical protein E2C01_051268 [Portunus trituberculatus]|jgi:hypothetical protein